MQITLEVSDDLATRILPAGENPARVMLELLAVEGYRTRRLSEHQVRIMLGFEIRMEVHAFLAEHEVPLYYTREHLEQDIRASDLLAQGVGQSGRAQPE